MDNELAKGVVDYNYIPNLKIASRPFYNQRCNKIKVVKSTNIQSYLIKYLWFEDAYKRDVMTSCVYFYRYVNKNIGIQFEPDAFKDNPGLIVM